MRTRPRKYFPGQHILIERPIRDDTRRDLRAPARSQRRNARKVNKRTGKIVSNHSNKQLLQETHQGRPAKTNTKHQTSAPPTMKAQPPKPPRAGNDVGVKFHAPRVLHPHHPQAYHMWTRPHLR